MLTQLRADEREAFLEDLAHIVTPGVDFFLYVLLAGLLIGLGFRLEQISLLFVGALVAPKLGPVIGKINFYRSGSSVSSFDGSVWTSHSVTNYAGPAKEAGTL